MSKRGEYKVKKLMNKCLFCQKEFRVYRYMLKTGKGKYCSHECVKKSFGEWIDKICLLCKKEYQVKPSLRNTNKYCSRDCKKKSEIGRISPHNKQVTRDCLKCGKQYKISSWKIEHGIGLYCSKYCTPKYFIKGKDHPFWKGNYETNDAIRKSPQYKEWQLSIYKRDNYECQICGGKSRNLRANHIKRFIDYPKLRFELNNGITICTPCDYKFVFNREYDWESYFNFNLMTRGFMKNEYIERLVV